MRPPLDGTVLLTGASAGIGRELARQLAPTASTLILVARRADRLRDLAAELEAARPDLRVVVKPCDLADVDDAQRLLDALAAELPPIDVLINNAGLGDVTLFDYADWAKLDQMLLVNCRVLTLLTHRLLPGMIARGRGGVLNVSSGFGLTFAPGLAAYAASKHYVTALTEGLRIEAAGTGVVVSQLCPGPVRTEFIDVAGNPTGQDIPGFVELTPDRCARLALRGFSRGRALIVPGFWIGVLLTVGRLTPRPILRLFYAPFARALRRRQAAAALTAPAAPPDSKASNG